jgi:uncharacterized membrane protein
MNTMPDYFQMNIPGSLSDPVERRKFVDDIVKDIKAQLAAKNKQTTSEETKDLEQVSFVKKFWVIIATVLAVTTGAIATSAVTVHQVGELTDRVEAISKDVGNIRVSVGKLETQGETAAKQSDVKVLETTIISKLNEMEIKQGKK